MRKHSICIVACIIMVLCFFTNAYALEYNAYINSKTRVYQYPSKSSRSVGVPRGLGVKVTGMKGGWCRVRRGKISAFIPTKYLTAASASKVNKVLVTAMDQVGKGYGRNTPKKFDCSSLVEYCFKKHGYSVKDTAHAIAIDNRYPKVSRNSIVKGDILCFDSNGDNRCDHVAIYLGGGYMVEASFTAQMVRVRKLDSWYKKHMMFARRVS